MCVFSVGILRYRYTIILILLYVTHHFLRYPGIFIVFPELCVRYECTRESFTNKNSCTGLQLPLIEKKTCFFCNSSLWYQLCVHKRVRFALSWHFQTVSPCCRRFVGCFHIIICYFCCCCCFHLVSDVQLRCCFWGLGAKQPHTPNSV